jgi:DNA-binding response OmpR family regulator
MADLLGHPMAVDHRTRILTADTVDEVKRRAMAAIDEFEEAIRQLLPVDDQQTFPHSWRLTPAEAEVLRMLAARPGPVRWQVLTTASGENVDDPRAVLRVNVCRLRSKLAKHAGLADVILTREWIGYEMTPAGREAIAEATGNGTRAAA